MPPTPVTVVWFKRDLRIHDHVPLRAAAELGRVIPLYVIEPEVLCAPDMDAMHFVFIRECLTELREDLAALGTPLVVRKGDPVEVLAALQAQYPINAIYAHEETGNALTFARDERVHAWSAATNIEFIEWPQTGVVRRLRSRDGWSRIWTQRMQQVPVDPPVGLEGVSIDPGVIEDEASVGVSHLHPASALRRQALIGGEASAEATLTSFLESRGKNYQREISAPGVAANACSRLSPYLAFGAISMRTVVDRTTASDLPSRARRAFLSRLHWHCHFMQKLESQPSIEFECFNPLYENLRHTDQRETYLAAWCEGRTGYPFVDACIRALQTMGWINFRMRAMLVSFAAYDLWLDWRSFKDFLARQFIDYEPGIHISQLQMQSGVTGINTPRMYNPVKQGYDHDPKGLFIRRWVPELEAVPDLFIHEPWKLSPLEIAETGFRPGIDYPERVVVHETAIREARRRIAEVRHSEAHRATAGAVFERHGSRKQRGDKQSSANYRRRRSGGQDGQRFDQPESSDGQLNLFE
ncbi:MAG: FAD-binding domain-containing protein [Woeseiaceae bacterium]